LLCAHTHRPYVQRRLKTMAPSVPGSENLLAPHLKFQSREQSEASARILAASPPHAMRGRKGETTARQHQATYITVDEDT